jgi:serine/threonine-protein phosphatase PP1-1
MEGFMWHFQERRLVTVWSAPNYCYITGNNASIMKLENSAADPDFKVFEAVPDKDRTIPQPLQYFL